MELLDKNNKRDPEAKMRHIDACILEDSQYKKSAGFDAYDLPYECAAGLDLSTISLATNFLGFALQAPLMIAPMTGGHEHGRLLNERWAKAAGYFGLPFGVGSQRLALENPDVIDSFLVRRHAKQTLIFANLGAAQFLKNYTFKEAMRAVRMIEADALFIHLNPLQEACQEGGDTDFEGLLRAISQVVNELHKERIKVLVREVGFGLSEKSVRVLIETGIDGLDCAGAGGTSWSKVEAMCANSPSMKRLGEIFGEWGIPTAESIKNVRSVSPNFPLIATGGLRSGVDVAKALALGADLGAMARPMLLAALKGEDELYLFIENVLSELRTAMFACGARDVGELKKIVCFQP